MSHLGQVTWTQNIRGELHYVDCAYGALEILLSKGQFLFSDPENIALLKRNPEVNIGALINILDEEIAKPAVNMERVNAALEKPLKQLIEQWIIEQYKKTRSYIEPEFFDRLRKAEPLDKDGATTLALFDPEKHLVATLALVIRTKTHPLLDLEARLNTRLPLFKPYSTDLTAL